jgi:hypothetical protein
MSGNLGLKDAKPDKNDCRTGKRISTSCRQNRRGLRHIAIKEHRHLMFKMTEEGLRAGKVGYSVVRATSHKRSRKIKERDVCCLQPSV